MGWAIGKISSGTEACKALVPAGFLQFFEQLNTYMLNIIKQLLGLGTKVDYRNLVQSGAVILDVRTPAEFKSGHIKGAINIPVDKLQGNLAKVQAMNKPVITCCRSGARSGMAVGILKKAGMEAYNGGPWNVLRSKIS